MVSKCLHWCTLEFEMIGVKHCQNWNLNRIFCACFFCSFHIWMSPPTTDRCVWQANECNHTLKLKCHLVVLFAEMCSVVLFCYVIPFDEPLPPCFSLSSLKYTKCRQNTGLYVYVTCTHDFLSLENIFAQK